MDQTGAVGGVFMSGGCDLEAVEHYLRSVARNLRLVANTIRRGAEIRRDHSAMVVRSVRPLDPAEQAFLDGSGYRAEDWSSDFASGRYSVAVFSFWADAYYQLYRHTGADWAIPFGPSNLGHTDIQGFGEHDLRARGVPDEGVVDFHYVRSAVACVGLIDEDRFKRNLRTILASVPQSTTVLVLALSEQVHGAGLWVQARHVSMNAWSREVMAGMWNARMISIDDVIADPAERLSPTHFSRHVYRRLAAEIEAVFKVAILPSSPASSQGGVTGVDNAELIALGREAVPLIY